jgi:hypothetical protein
MSPYFQFAFVARSVLHSMRCAFAMAAIACATSAGAQPAFANFEATRDSDYLSMLSDFGVADITGSMGPAGSADLAGIKQSGGSNRALIIQTQVNGGNNAQIWQLGDDNSARVAQDGDMNTVRLWQEGSGHYATLTQFGSGNQIAAVQYGADSFLSGTQTGNGNVAAVVLEGGSRLTFSQQGDNNSIVGTLPSNSQALDITQTSVFGHGMSLNIVNAYQR